MEHTQCKLHMELTPWKLLHGTYTMKLPHQTYTMEVTSWTLHHGSYLMEHTP